MFRSSQNVKIGNTLIYLIDKIGTLYLTKAIKLLYILDEISIKETGVPFTWLEYKAWKKGPVPQDIYEELRNNVKCESDYCTVTSLHDYVGRSAEKNKKRPDFEMFRLVANREFCDDEFTDYEINLLNRVIKEYGKMTSDQLIDLLHEQGSLWDKVVKENNLEFDYFLQHDRSDVTIPLITLIKEDPLRQMAYKVAYTSLTFESQTSEF